ncbi:MAG: hypothetical protein HOO99_06855 [Hyphomicrobiaceae bacterium]|nr:hypothetical protein [Hyphomicrobiaceae bacterium]
MDITSPKPAQVIRYAYLWADEHDAGREEGVKDRPAAIVMTLQSSGQDLRVAVVPITHSPPAPNTDAIEIPAHIKRHLGLDDEPSWVILTELNVFNWPGPDLRPASSDYNASPIYGTLPAGFFRIIRDRLVANIRAGQIRQVPRTE